MEYRPDQKTGPSNRYEAGNDRQSRKQVVSQLRQYRPVNFHNMLQNISVKATMARAGNAHELKLLLGSMKLI